MEHDNSSISQNYSADKKTADMLSDSKENSDINSQDEHENLLVLSQSKSEETHINQKLSEKTMGVMIGIMSFVILIASIGIVGFFFFWDGKGIQEGAKNVQEDVRVSSDKLQKDEVGLDTDVHSVICQEVVMRDALDDMQVSESISTLRREINRASQDSGGEQITFEETCMIKLFLEDLSQASGDVNDELKYILMEGYVQKYGLDMNKVTSMLAAVQAYDNAVALHIEQDMEIHVTVPAVLLCLDDDGYVTEPVDGMPLCKVDGMISDVTWPSLNRFGGRWGGCEMVVEHIGTQPDHFVYCATLSDGTIFTCTESGCHANDEMVKK